MADRSSLSSGLSPLPSPLVVPTPAAWDPASDPWPRTWVDNSVDMLFHNNCLLWEYFLSEKQLTFILAGYVCWVRSFFLRIIQHTTFKGMCKKSLFCHWKKIDLEVFFKIHFLMLNSIQYLKTLLCNFLLNYKDFWLFYMYNDTMLWTGSQSYGNVYLLVDVLDHLAHLDHITGGQPVPANTCRHTHYNIHFWLIMQLYSLVTSLLCL